MRSDVSVHTFYVGARISGGKSTWWRKWDVPQAIGFVAVDFDDDISIFMTLTLYFVNIVEQSSSQSWPIEMRYLVFRLSRMSPDRLELESLGVSYILTEWVAHMEFPLDALTFEPMFFFLMCT